MPGHYSSQQQNQFLLHNPSLTETPNFTVWGNRRFQLLVRQVTTNNDASRGGMHQQATVSVLCRSPPWACLVPV